MLSDEDIIMWQQILHLVVIKANVTLGLNMLLTGAVICTIPHRR